MPFCSHCGSEVAANTSNCANCGNALQSQGEVLTAEPVTWTPIAEDGSLVLVSSDYEYVVHDHNQTYGRWPKTRQNYRTAMETFGAYSQSRAHGVAYSTTGYQDPERLGLPTTPVVESRTYAAPLSYVGSTRRIVRWTKGALQRNPGLQILLWIVTVLALLLSWAFVTAWYLVIFGFFGIFMIPYRLVRRSQRKSLHVQQSTLATQQAMLQQMTAITNLQGTQQQSPGLQHSPHPGMARPAGQPPLPPG